MYTLLHKFLRLFKKEPASITRLREAIRTLTKSTPRNISLYKLAFQHSSIDKKDSNERLEFLGDAVLACIVGEYLFKKYPNAQEDFLTEARSRVVKRDTLNDLAIKLGLGELIKYKKSLDPTSMRLIYGNALEALIGAIYLDQGYVTCRKIVLERLLIPYLDLTTVVQSEHNHKGKILEWGQKAGKRIQFIVTKELYVDNQKSFCVDLVVDGETLSTGTARVKKEAEQRAAKEACQILGINNNVQTSFARKDAHLNV